MMAGIGTAHRVDADMRMTAGTALSVVYTIHDTCVWFAEASEFGMLSACPKTALIRFGQRKHYHH